VREFAEASLQSRQEQHDAILLKYFRSLDGGSEISSEVSSSTEDNNTARDGTEEGANPVDQEGKDDEDDEISGDDDEDSSSVNGSSDEDIYGISSRLTGADGEGHGESRDEEEDDDEEI